MSNRKTFSRRDFLKLLALLPVAYARQALDRAQLYRDLPGSGSDAPGVILIVLDALSASNMSLYGYPRRTTPNMERFARRSNVYHAHYSTANFTSSGTASLLTGTYPWTHRAFHYESRIVENRINDNIFRNWGETGYRLGYTQNAWVDMLLFQFSSWLDRHVPLEELSLSKAPLNTGIFRNDPIVSLRSLGSYTFKLNSGLSAYPFLASLLKIQYVLGEKAWDDKFVSEYPLGIPRTVNDADVYFVLEDVFDGLMKLTGNLPSSALAYFHLYPPHHPYAPRKEYVDTFKQGWQPAPKPPAYFLTSVSGQLESATRAERQKYDSYIASVDAEFGRLYDFMEREGILERNYVMLTSDHGDLYERGVVGHINEYLYEPLVHIPLIISGPRQASRMDIHSPTSSVDVAPTLLSVTGRQVPAECEGMLLPGLGGREDAERSIFSIDTKSSSVRGPIRNATVALRKGQYKLIAYLNYKGYEDGFELYDLQSDPEETSNIAASKPGTFLELKREIEAKLYEINAPFVAKT